MKKVNIRLRLSLCARCLKDAKCYLAYMSADKLFYSPSHHKNLIDYLISTKVSGDTIITDTVRWDSSNMGEDYWENKFEDVVSYYRKYIMHVKNERIHNTR